MGQKKARTQSAAERQTQRVVAALEETVRNGRAPAFVCESPGRFLRDMYEVWHRQGGMEGGRWRNSIRRMREEWLVGRRHVPSLHPKLMGRVKLTRSDARALISLFVERWRQAEDADPVSVIRDDGYVGFEAPDRRHLTTLLLRSMFGPSQSAIELPLQEGHARGQTDDLHVDRFIESDYSQCDALITFSRGRIAVGPNPANTIKSFVQLFRAFYNEDQRRPGKDKIFIWIVDFGQRLVESDDSFIEYFNAGFLALLLQAFARFDSEFDDDREDEHGKYYRRLRIQDSKERLKRWRWLTERSVVIVENLRLDDVDSVYADEDRLLASIPLRDIPVTRQHILPQEPPPNWIKDIKSLVGSTIDMRNISFTALLNKDGWRGNQSAVSDLKCYAHARILRSPNSDFATATVQSVALGSAGPIYEDALRILYLAAVGRLRGPLDVESDEAVALAYLKDIKFSVLRVQDFIHVHTLGSINRANNYSAAREVHPSHENSTV